MMFCTVPLFGQSQISLNPVSMGLGGGGTAYTTSYEALFINPANLQLREKTYRMQVSVLESGSYFNSPLQVKNAINRIENYEQTLRTSGADDFTLTEDSRESILNRHFATGRLNREFQSSSVVNWIGVKWFREERSYAFSVRSRQASRYTIGRGFYDNSPIESGDIEVIDRSLSHQFQTLHEISFGYSESFSFLSGLFPNISRFIIGVAPKVVLSGPTYSTNHTDFYSREDESSSWVRENSYSFESTGVFSDHAERLQAGRDPFNEGGGINSMSELTEPTGVGAAIDLGITYLFTFGSDLSLIRRGEEPTEKSLRVSLSLTDLGMIHYFEQPFRADTGPVEPEFADPVGLSDTYFTGGILQDFNFLSNGMDHPLRSATNQNRDNYQSLLPASIQTGILFQINRVKMMGDIRLGLNDSAFQSSKFMSFIGAEVRPLSFLPLRAGTRIATDLPGYYSFGAGIETRYFDLNAAIQFRSTSKGPTLEPVAASVAAIKFYIP